MRLNGDKVYLDTLDEHHVTKNYKRWLRDAEVLKYAGRSKLKPQTKEQIIKYVEDMNTWDNVRQYAIFEKISGKHIGNIRIDVDWIYSVATVNILIGEKDCWGKGYGTEAIKLIVGFSFSDLNMNRCEAGILDGNVGSIKAFERNGFQLEGVRRQRRFNEGKFVDELMMGKLKEAE